jgi:hypothetical protein
LLQLIDLKQAHQLILQLFIIVEDEDLTDWRNFFLSKLESELQSIVDMKKKWEEDGDGFGLSGDVLDDYLYHAKLARDHCKNYTRKQLLHNIIHFLQQPTQSTTENSSFNGIALVLIGERGSGKSTLCSQLCAHLYEMECNRCQRDTNDESGLTLTGDGGSCTSEEIVDRFPIEALTSHDHDSNARLSASSCDGDGLQSSFIKTKVKRPVIIRFCGLNDASKTGYGLIRSICSQIEYIWKHNSEANGGKRFINNNPTYDEAVEYFHYLLKIYPVFLILVGLNRLSDENQARRKLSFLADIQPHEVHAMISLVFRITYHTLSPHRILVL